MGRACPVFWCAGAYLRCSSGGETGGERSRENTAGIFPASEKEWDKYQKREGIKRMKIKSFQALRFLMISSIFLAHISFVMTNEKATSFFYHYLNNGVFGVTFFFMLSGFCLNLGYHDRLAN